MKDIIVSCTSISKSFGASKVIDNLSINILAGNTLITGANGSGKSTLLMLIAGIEVLNAGKILFIDHNKQSNCSISTDAIDAPDVFTLNELLIMQNKFNKIDDILLKYLITETGLTAFLHNKISNVSTGTKKKFSVICALVKDANIFLLDEPFNGVDEHSREVLKTTIESDERSKIIVDHKNILPFEHSISL